MDVALWSYKWIGLDGMEWSPGGVKYRAAYDAKNWLIPQPKKGVNVSTYFGSNHPVLPMNEFPFIFFCKATSLWWEICFVFEVAGAVCAQINGKYLSVGQGTMLRYRSMLGVSEIRTTQLTLHQSCFS